MGLTAFQDTKIVVAWVTDNLKQAEIQRGYRIIAFLV